VGGQIATHFWFYQGKVLKKNDVTKRDTIEESVKHGLVNQYPESGMWFRIVNTNGVANRAPIKPLHQISAVVLDVDMQYWLSCN
jgi:hypothetical protein